MISTADDASVSASKWSVWLGWPAFLASSWAWLIGLYLPVLLLDVYGWLGALIFTIPNVAGVILFGRVIGSPAESRAFIEAHRRAMVIFSFITVAFHCYCLAWIWNAEFHVGWFVSLLTPIALFLFASLFTSIGDTLLRRIGAAAYALSIALLAGYALTHAIGAADGQVTRPPFWEPGQRSGPILLAPIIFAGFLLCPYFDLSFHRALQAIGGGGNGRNTFMMFGVLFVPVILFTCLYAIFGFTRAVALHLLVQSWFTMAVHVREIAQSRWPSPKQSGEWLAIAVAAVFLAPLPLVLFEYRSWFLTYGIAFPAYAIFVVIRRRLGRAALGVGWVLWFTALSAPFAWIGMTRHQEWLLLVPALVMALVAFVGPQTTSPRSAATVNRNEEASEGATATTTTPSHS